MTAQDIQNAKQRAEDVVNGFSTVKTRNAHDALKLANTLILREKQIKRLQNELQKHIDAEKCKDITDLFGGIFK